MLLALLHAHLDQIALAGSWITGWYSKVTASKLAARRDRLDAGAQALELTSVLSVREKNLGEELERIKRNQWTLLEKVQDIYAEAIAVRLIVHDLDAAAGRPLRQFRPLPPYPFPAQSDGSVAGATAAPTAEPRAETVGNGS